MRWIVGLLLLAGLVAVLIAAGPQSDSDEAGGSADEPAQVEPIAGTDVSRVRLSADAARRLGIETAAVERRGRQRTVIPYDAVLYDPEGHTFTYTSPKPLVFVRHAINVGRIAGDRAVLTGGPPPGTAVVTVGSQELFGTEFAVEED
jgi:hypothetical protein